MGLVNVSARLCLQLTTQEDEEGGQNTSASSQAGWPGCCTSHAVTPFSAPVPTKARVAQTPSASVRPGYVTGGRAKRGRRLSQLFYPLLPLTAYMPRHQGFRGHFFADTRYSQDYERCLPSKRSTEPGRVQKPESPDASQNQTGLGSLSCNTPSDVPETLHPTTRLDKDAKQGARMARNSSEPLWGRGR